MELFYFRQMTSTGYMSEGRAINGITSVMWVERYRNPGEFKIKSPVSAQLHLNMPVGTLISHVDTLEVMIVENHEIDEDVEDTEPEVVTTGRSLEAWLENRIVGEDIETYPIPGGGRLYLPYFDYVEPLATSWEQAVSILDRHLNDSEASLEILVPGFVPISNQQHIGTSTALERIIRKQNLHKALLELLAVDDFGIKTVRPNPNNVDPTTTEFRVHNGFDLTDSVVFSHAAGDLEKARYFWSIRNDKTDFYAVSSYYEMRSDSANTGFNRRTLLVDCSDMDGHLSDEQAADSLFTDVVGVAMDSRGTSEVLARKPVSLLSTDISKTTKYKFRKHYDVGDIVMVNGNHGVSTIMRVSEHAEFEDENGETGYPTLSAVNE